jgi:hypothetical protein
MVWSNGSCPMSYVLCPLSFVLCPLFFVLGPLSIVHCPLSIVLYTLSFVLYPLSFILSPETWPPFEHTCFFVMVFYSVLQRQNAQWGEKKKDGRKQNKKLFIRPVYANEL